MADNPTPIVSVSALQEGAFADLTRSFSVQALQNIVIEASRWCEDETGHRLMPFTVTETHRAAGIDPDEFAAVGGGVPMDILGTLGASYAQALGSVGDWVRHVWLHEHPPAYPDMWTWGSVTVNVTRAIGGGGTPTILLGPTDTGELWFRLGNFIPIGSRLVVTYGGGYSTYPASLVRAAKFAAAAICCRELDPLQAQNHGHNSDDLLAEATSWLGPFGRAD